VALDVALGEGSGPVGVVAVVSDGVGPSLGDALLVLASGDGVVVALPTGDALASGDGLAEGVAVAVADAVGLASGVGPAVGSARATVAGPATSAAATSRVPARRSRTPRAVVGVDIGAFPERSVT
jgi:hypothetical protein